MERQIPNNFGRWYAACRIVVEHHWSYSASLR
jgi:hypothetical protein